MAMTRRRWMQGAAAAAVCAIPGIGAAAAPDRAGAPDQGNGARGGKGEAKAAGGRAQKINLNDASKAELMKLEGVGAGAADRIIAYRDAHGPFKRVQDLEKVDKVGKIVLEKNAGRLAVK